MAAKAKAKEVSMEEALWKSADKLRGSVEPSEYKHVVLSLFFLKFASDKFEAQRARIIADGMEKFVDNIAFYTKDNVFYLPQESRWTYIMENAKQDDIALKIDTALFTIEKTNPILKGALPDNYYSRLQIDTVEVHGSLIEQVDKTVDLVYTKYLKALIFYDGIQRVEQFMFHQDAFREILLNAIVHKDYSSCNPIQISVYEDKIYVWNDGEMPSGLDSADKLFMKHSSKPYNPKLAGVFFKSGMIEAWGRGFDKIREACAKYDAPLPEYNISASGIMVFCKACDKYLDLLNEDSRLGQSDQDNDQDVTKMIIAFCKQPHSAKEIMEYIKINDRSFFRRHYLNPMIKTGQLKMTIPDKPKSGNQKYYV